MEVQSRDQQIATFSQMGKLMGQFASGTAWPGFACGLAQDEYEAFQQLIATHFQSNGWFTEANIKKALGSWSKALTRENLEKWLSAYPENIGVSKNIGVICAGNIPLVGFHDVLSVILAGHKALIKLSSEDNKLIPALLFLAAKLDPTLTQRFEIIPQKLTGFDAVIATGSTNTGRYFEYYFRDIPHIIRKGRTSVAVLTGNETEEELNKLGNDMFDYFGLGCRSVSKVYIPEDFDLDRLFGAIYPFHEIVNHNKYANNYDYNKAVWMLNKENLLDNGFILLKEDKALASPVASLFYERYSNIENVNAFLSEQSESLQCVVGHGRIPFGDTQCPMLWDYADDVDTLKFLVELQ